MIARDGRRRSWSGNSGHEENGRRFAAQSVLAIPSNGDEKFRCGRKAKTAAEAKRVLGKEKSSNAPVWVCFAGFERELSQLFQAATCRAGLKRLSECLTPFAMPNGRALASMPTAPFLNGADESKQQRRSR